MTFSQRCAVTQINIPTDDEMQVYEIYLKSDSQC